MAIKAYTPQIVGPERAHEVQLLVSVRGNETFLKLNLQMYTYTTEKGWKCWRESNCISTSPHVGTCVYVYIYISQPVTRGCGVRVGFSHLKETPTPVSSALLCNVVAVCLTFVQCILQLKLCTLLCTFYWKNLNISLKSSLSTQSLCYNNKS